MSEKALRVVATGDMFITRRIAEDGYEGFEELSDCIKEHDVKFSNLEMTFHNQEGYPAAVSGGTWAMMEPEALDDVNVLDSTCIIQPTTTLVTMVRRVFWQLSVI